MSDIFNPTILNNASDTSLMTDGDMGFSLENKKIYLKTSGRDPESYGGLSKEEIENLIQKKLSSINDATLYWNVIESVGCYVGTPELQIIIEAPEKIDFSESNPESIEIQFYTNRGVNCHYTIVNPNTGEISAFAITDEQVFNRHLNEDELTINITLKPDNNASNKIIEYVVDDYNNDMNPQNKKPSKITISDMSILKKYGGKLDIEITGTISFYNQEQSVLEPVTFTQNATIPINRPQ